MLFGRNQGVTIPKGQRNAGLEKGPPNTIGAIAEVKQYAVQWFDEAGKQHPDMWVRIGNIWYKPVNSEEWASEIGQVKDTFINQAEAMVAPKAGKDAAPTEDSVDVVASSVAATPPPANVEV